MTQSDDKAEVVASIASRTILIADDDDDFRSVLKHRCQSISGIDCSVLDAEDALTALSYADVANPDLLILDVDMPGSGLAACEMLASDESFAGIPVVILTGRKDDATVQRCRLMSAHYVHKSSDMWRQLEGIIRKEFSNAVRPRKVGARLLSSP